MVASALPHIDIVHLVFNLYWWWYFGTRIERAWGPLRLLGLSLLLAATSDAAETAITGSQGVGLSGIAYGLVALLYLAQRAVPALAGAVTPYTLKWFAVWFALCVGLTVGGVWNIGNLAHAAGAIVGGLVGAAIAQPERRVAWASAVVLLLISIVGATVLRPWMMFDPRRSAILGYEALQQGRDEEAMRHLELAVKKNPADAPSWANLGSAYLTLKRYDDAIHAYERSISLDGSTAGTLNPALANAFLNKAYAAGTAGDYAGARQAAEAAIRVDPGYGEAWRSLGLVQGHLNDYDAAQESYQRGIELATPEQRESNAFQEQIAEDMGALEAGAGEHRTAAARFRVGLAVNPANAALWMRLGQSLEALGSDQAALEAYEEAAKSETLRSDAEMAATAVRARLKR